MPIYDYHCNDCHRRVSILTKDYSTADTHTAECPLCGGRHLTRLVSRVAVVRSEGSRLESLADDSLLDGLDDADPRTVGRWMRRMSRDMEEDMGDELAEVADRLEAGQTPEDIESSMPQLGPVNDAI
jgi:putative FmdB family regulatory protein